ncbi:MAG: porin [Gammaproteobacteria bacterium]|nr:porin [Gammaproteobacteria bacterium]
MNLKKSALAVAVASIIATPAATTVYAADHSWNGRVHYRLEMDEDEDLSMHSAGHRIAVGGSADSNGGQKIGYFVEGEIQSDTNPVGPASRSGGDLEWRHHNVYISGDWGEARIGRQNNPHNQVYKTDIFERESGPHQIAPFRVGDAAIYSGDFGVFGLYGGLVMDGQGVEPTGTSFADFDSIIYGANFNIGKSVAITVGGQEIDIEGSTGVEHSIVGVGASWSAGSWYVAGEYETDSVKTAPSAPSSDVDVFALAVLWKMPNGNTSLGGGYSVESPDTGSAPSQDETRIMLGAYHNLGGGADTYLEYGDTDLDNAPSNFPSTRITWGFRVKWN